MCAMYCHVISAKYILFVSELATPHRKTLRLAIYLQRVKKITHASWRKALKTCPVYLKNSLLKKSGQKLTQSI
jgi:hypothetical protein